MKKRHDTSEEKRPLHSWISPEVLCALFAAIAAFGSCFVAILQYQKNAKDASLDRRPWIVLRHVNLPSLEVGKPFKFTFEVHNEGRLPAENVQSASQEAWLFGNATMTEADWLQQEHTALDKMRGSLNFVPAPSIAPGASDPVMLQEPKALTSEENEGMANGTRRILIFGQINYTDLDGNPGSTKFCSFVRADVIDSTVTTLSCPFWNEMQ